MRVSLIGLIVLLFLMPGCGGGGSSTAPLATKLRAVQPGDQWVYTITGQVLNPTTGKNQPLTGNLTLSLSTVPFNGASVLALTTTLNLTAAGVTTPLTEIVYLQQDPTTGNVQDLGDTGGLSATGGASATGGVSTQLSNETLTTPQTLFPGAWSSGVAINTTLNFGNGNTQQYALNVTGSSTVNTPAGNFAVWMANAGTGSGLTEAWAPQLGAPVKIILQGGALATGSATAILQSTTVPH